MISDEILTPEIVKPLPSQMHEGQSRLVRQAGLAGDSPSLSSFTSRVYDAFTDGDYTISPAWTVESGTWSAASGALVPTPQSGVRAISTANSYGNADIWYAFKRTGTGGALDNALLQLRYVDENNWLGVRFMWNMLIVVEKVSGVEQDLAYTAVNSFAAQDVWYDVYVQLDGSSVVLFACERGDTVQRLLETSTNLGTSTSALRVRVNGVMPFEFDDFRVCSRSIHAGQSMVFTYGPANQLATMTTSGVTSSYTYDPWGRLASRSATIGGQSYTATYTYRFGDKLKRIGSNFPGETPVVLYNYDGLGKRRLKAVGNDTTYWRWDAGYSVLAQYGDSSPDWNTSGFDRFFVPFGHTALAEADLEASGVPANAAYTYLAHDHLGTSYYGFNQSKTVVSQNVHLPLGQRMYVTGNSPYHEFTGKPWDAEAQLYYFPYRYYSTNMNRWTAVDPAGLIDGPNIYVFAGANPIKNKDISGLFTIKGNCQGRSSTIKEIATATCKNIDNIITDANLARCIKNRCRNGMIRCDPCCPAGTAGYNIWVPRISQNNGRHIYWRSQTANICINNHRGDGRIAQVIIHEWAHSCGWQHGEGMGVPLDPGPDPNGPL